MYRHLLIWTVFAAALLATLPASTEAAPPTAKEVIALWEEANKLHAEGEYDQVEEIWQHLVPEVRRLWGEGSTAHGHALGYQALASQDIGRYEQAESLYPRALRILEAKLGKDHLEVARVLYNQAVMFQNMERDEQAEPLYQRALGILEAKLDKDATETAVALNNLARLYQDTERYEQAEPLLRRALTMFEGKLGKDHHFVATPLTNLAGVCMSTGRPEQAEPLYKRALAIREAKLGLDHPFTRTALTGLTELYKATGRSELAESLFQRHLEIKEAKLGKDHPDVANALVPLAGLYQATGRDELAESLFKRILNIFEAKLGKDHQEVAFALVNLGHFYLDSWRYKEAEPLLKRSLNIIETNRGKDHLDVAIALAGLADVLRDAGQYQEAEPFYKRRLEILEAKLGKDHLDVTLALDGLASLYEATGRYEKAEPLLRRCVEIREAKLGKDHPYVATALMNLASLYEATGRYEKAELLLVRCLEIREAKLGKDHPTVARALESLATVYRETGRYEKAEPLLRRSLEILEAKLGKDHPYVASALAGLANVYRDLGQYKQAEPLLKRTLNIWEAKFGKDHRNVAGALNDLANLYRNTERDEQAETLYKRSLEIKEARLGKDHPSVALALDNLASLYQASGRIDLAAGTLDRSRRIVHRHVTCILPGLGESEQLDFLYRADSSALHGALSLGLAQPAEAGLTALSAVWLLNAKGLAEQTRAQAILTARSGRDPRLAPDLQELLDVRRQLAQLSLQEAKPGQEDRHKNRLAQLTTREEELAASLRSKGAATQPPSWIDLKQVRDALPADAVFVDLARVEVYEAGKLKRQPARYVAWITPKNGPPQLIDIGEAKTIDDAVTQVRLAMEEAPKVLKAQGETPAEKAVREPLARLAKLVLEPLRPHLDKAARWVISPDGDLWLVPWAALPLDEKTYTIEKHTLQLVVSGRYLLPRLAGPGTTTAPVIFADPDFDGAAPVPPAELRSLSGGLKLGRIPRLPGTAIEAESVADKVAKVFGAAPVVHTEGKATSEAFLKLNRPRALTLATHGFFLPGQGLSEEELDRLLRDPEAKPKAQIEDPLLRCGLLLAGCNKPGDAGRAGVLTGREVLSADLRGCELVVLSACETGLGDIRQGEGIAGLRQAFQLAGAESVLASLWRVPDDETTLQMVAFMDALAKGKDRVEALAEAQRARITQRREKFGAAHPFNWAAFTLTGTAR